MKKVIFLLLSLSIFSGNLLAQTGPDTTWRRGGIFNVNFNQVSLSNWAQGGENSVTLTSLLNTYANYKHNKLAWDNNLDLAYGLLKQGDADLRKNEDKIDLTSKVGYAVNQSKWYYSALFNFKSQFTNGYAYPNDSVVISKFGAPAYFLLSLGMNYKPNADFALFLSPITSRLTLVNDQDLADAGSYGVDPAEYSTGVVPEKIKDGKKTRNEVGAYLNATYKKEILTNVVLSTKLELFSNYSENPQNIDVNWDVLLAMKVNKYISASIYTQLVYDDNTPVPLYEGTGSNKNTTGFGPRTQFKEVLGIGFAYKFSGVTAH